MPTRVLTGCTVKIQSLYFLSYTAPDDVISNLIPDTICRIFTLSYEVSFVPINYPKVVQKSQNKNQLINAMHVDLAGCKWNLNFLWFLYLQLPKHILLVQFGNDSGHNDVFW